MASSVSGSSLGRPGKRLIIACDGTWVNSDSGLQSGKLEIPSNVTRIARAIKPISTDGIAQIVYYQAGVGSQGGPSSRVSGGVFGQGVVEHIREAYAFLTQNYIHGDEIFLIGFSRGAFTARSVGGFICDMGLLTRDGQPYFAEIFKDWKERYNPNYRPTYPNLPFRNKPSASDPMYAETLEKRGLTTLEIPIKAIGVWETVGSLGIPRVGWLERVGLQSRTRNDFCFNDTALSDTIEYAFQALALDERRDAFQPAVWEKPRGNTTRLAQCWFPGSHSNVGGGYPDQEIANITLAWMMSNLGPFIDMDMGYILDEYQENRRYYQRNGRSVRPWSFGKVYDSMTGIYDVGGSSTRTPGEYHRTNPVNGESTPYLLRDTNEYIHPCVRSRLCLDGPGVDDRGYYSARALRDYDLRVGRTAYEGEQPRVEWVLRTRRERKVLKEWVLKDTERRLLRKSLDMYDYVFSGSGQARSDDVEDSPSRGRKGKERAE